MKKEFLLMLVLCLLLCGCESWTDGYYHHVTPHPITGQGGSTTDATVENYNELLTAMLSLVRSGAEHGIFYVPKYDESQLETDIKAAIQYAKEFDPIGAYAVEEVTWELGSSGGQNAAAIDVAYLHDSRELLKISRVENMQDAGTMIRKALDDCAPSVVLFVKSYVDTDFIQLVEDYADANPQSVMEKPQTVASVYPETGINRVVELKFSYQNSRETLRNMQTQVSPVFAAAALYVSGDSSETEKLSQLYSFLMERYDYRLETSITPAYSLLRHGVGDNKAFAMVYAVMCRQAGMECQIVTGTRAGEPWYWNLVRDGDNYYHVDLLSCSEMGIFRELTDSQMTGYVWDYSGYPKSELPDTPAGNNQE